MGVYELNFHMFSIVHVHTFGSFLALDQFDTLYI